MTFSGWSRCAGRWSRLRRFARRVLGRTCGCRSQGSNTILWNIRVKDTVTYPCPSLREIRVCRCDRQSHVRPRIREAKQRSRDRPLAQPSPHDYCICKYLESIRISFKIVSYRTRAMNGMRTGDRGNCMPTLVTRNNQGITRPNIGCANKIYPKAGYSVLDHWNTRVTRQRLDNRQRYPQRKLSRFSHTSNRNHW